MGEPSAFKQAQQFGESLVPVAAIPSGGEEQLDFSAALIAPERLQRAEPLDQQCQAREQQQRIEERRLAAHQRIAFELLSDEARRAWLLESAHGEVRRWSEERLCSQDYIDRWSDWLRLPAPVLVTLMCSDAGGWGNAMRQNSPFSVLPE